MAAYSQLVIDTEKKASFFSIPYDKEKHVSRVKPDGLDIRRRVFLFCLTCDKFERNCQFGSDNTNT